MTVNVGSRLLYSRDEAAQLLGGICTKTLSKLPIRFVKVGKRKLYAESDLQDFINNNKEDFGKCQLEKEKGRRSTSTASRLKVLDFAEALKRLT